MANHYITIDNQNRIIDGFSDAFKLPQSTDILLRTDAGEAFELFGGDPERPLSFMSYGVEVWIYKWCNGAPAKRSPEEIDVDLAPIPEEPSLQDQVATNTYDIETLNMALNILLNGG